MKINCVPVFMGNSLKFLQRDMLLENYIWMSIPKDLTSEMKYIEFLKNKMFQSFLEKKERMIISNVWKIVQW